MQFLICENTRAADGVRHLAAKHFEQYGPKRWKDLKTSEGNTPF